MYSRQFCMVALCASVVPLLPEPAAAQWSGWDGYGASGYQQRQRTRPKARAQRPKAAPAQRLKAVETPQRRPSGPLFAVVSLADQKVSIYDTNGIVARSPVSTGKVGHRTPTGIFSVIQKNRWHRSNIYSNAPMPFMQRLTWSGIAMHEGMLPGYPASHGCIRLPRSFAMQWWGMTRLGVRVVVAPQDVTFQSFDSPVLPRPVFVPAPVADAGAPLQQTRLAAAGGAAEGVTDAAQAPARMLNPVENAVATRNSQRIAAADAAKAAKAAQAASLQASAAAREAAVELRRAEARLASVREEQRADAETAALDARAREMVRSSAAFAAGRAAREAEDASQAAASALKAAERAVEPLHVFISRKEKKLYVRQGFTPLFDAPVSFKDPDAPLGTHLFTALGPDANGAGLTWNVLTMPERGGPPEREPARRGKQRAAPAPSPPPPHVPAAAALARVEIAPETLQRLNERIWTGASLIISDHPIGPETGLGTDFIVLTR